MQFNTMKTFVRVDGAVGVVGVAWTGIGNASSSFSSAESWIEVDSFDMICSVQYTR